MFTNYIHKRGGDIRPERKKYLSSTAMNVLRAAEETRRMHKDQIEEMKFAGSDVYQESCVLEEIKEVSAYALPLYIN